jgi:hypothetical protein
VEEVKKPTSKWLKSKGVDRGQFYWQGGYGMFSVSESNKDKIIKYIDNQQEHHKTMTFQDELRALLRRHRVEFDETYLWD